MSLANVNTNIDIIVMKEYKVNPNMDKAKCYMQNAAIYHR